MFEVMLPQCYLYINIVNTEVKLRGVLVISLLIVSTLAFGQSGLLEAAWKTSGSKATLAEAERLLSSTVLVNQKKKQSELQYLKRLFNHTQKKIFTSYSQYASMDEILKGKYDCLTATTWFAALLTKAGFQFEVIETNYHIFLMVHTSQQDVLIETTDRFNGFVLDRNQIQKRLGVYQQNIVASNANSEENYLYHFQLFREVAPEKLAGLLYFNQSVKAYNAKDLKLCAEKLQLARCIYETPRVAELADILLQSIAFNKDLTATEKELIKKQFSPYKGATGMPLASR